ncbi:hypothetical protein V2J09_023550 [Rumex salicifolius]
MPPSPSSPAQSMTGTSLSFSSAIDTTAFLPPDPDNDPDSESIFGISFNQDFTCFAVATDRGFQIYNANPFREIFRRTFSREASDPSHGGGGIASVQMLFRCNILAVVGGGDRPQYPPSKVMIWNDHECRCIGELSFRSDVKSVRLRRDRIIVALLQKVFVYNFVDLKLLHQIETFANPKGLCEISCASNSLVLACLGLQKGQIRVEHYAIKRTKFIMAHDSRIAAMALTQDGRIMATASSKGTLVRIFNTLDATLLQEVRRGTDRAEIQSLAFSPSAQWFAVSSNRGTVHVFNLKLDSSSPGNSVLRRTSSEPIHYTPPPVSSLSFMKGVLPKYFSSEWSVAQFHLREGILYSIAFGQQENTIVIVGMDGRRTLSNLTTTKPDKGSILPKF